ncbi:MAG: hypothetical protein GC154_01305 [bacterium]|nr:hypothetical protein [bacterium]
MTSNPEINQETRDQMKQSPQPQGLTGRGYASGLLMTGVVIVGSWMGMAAYVDYRLQGMEDQLSGNTQTIVSHVDDNQKQLEGNLIKRVNDTSSVLAKGLLEMTETTGQRFDATMEKLASYQDSVNQSQQSLAQSIKTDLSDSQNAVLQKIASENKNLAAQLAQHIDQNQSQQSESLQSALAKLDTNQSKYSKEILTSVKEVGNNVTQTRSVLSDAVTSSMKSLQELVSSDSATSREEFKQLAGALNGFQSQEQGGSETILSQLKGMATQIDSLHQNVSAARGSMEDIQNTMPQFREAYDAQWKQMQTRTDEMTAQLTQQISQLQKSLALINQSLKEASESVLNAVYVNTQGLEGTRAEIKSDLALSHDETSEQLQNLTATIQSFSTVLQGLSPDSSDLGMSSAINIQSSLDQFSSTLRQTQTMIAEAILPQLKVMQSQSPDAAPSLEKAVSQIETMINDAQNQIDRVSPASSGSVAINSTPSASSQEGNAPPASPSPDPEQRTPQALGFSLY